MKVLFIIPVILFGLESFGAGRVSKDLALANYVRAQENAVVTAARKAKLEGAKIDLASLRCVAVTEQSGACVASGDMSFPNSDTDFVITVSKPNFADCDNKVELTVAAVDGEC